MGLQERTSGILLPIFSLPGTKYTGALGRGARKFADFLQASGQRWWQLLPLNPIDFVNSPYSSCSAFAGEPLFLDLEDLVEQKLLDPEDLLDFLEEDDSTAGSHVDYHSAQESRRPLHRKAFLRFKEGYGGEKYRTKLSRFREENRIWLPDFTIYHALSIKFGTPSWRDWPEEYRYIENSFNADGSLNEKRRKDSELLELIEFAEFLQLVFEIQWHEFKQYCNDRQIELLGDVPIYLGQACADTWAHHELFQMDRDGNMKRVAGVPGDTFNPEGQCWNLPLYDWKKHQETDYAWWLARMRQTLKRFDAIRLDHFIGFYNYFSFPEKGAEGEPVLAPFDQKKSVLEYEPGWLPGPQRDFFDKMFAFLPRESFIAEDLGVMNRGVHELRDDYALPGMEVLQFSFDWNRNDDPTQRWCKNSVVCTGTHDTPPVLAWLDLLDREGPHRSGGPLFTTVWHILLQYQKEEEKIEIDFSQHPELCGEESHFWRYSVPNQEAEQALRDGIPTKAIPLRPDILSLRKAILRMVMSSPGNTALFPLQDVLGCGGEARMNFPGRSDGNWKWRVRSSALSEKLASELKQLVMETDR